MKFLLKYKNLLIRVVLQLICPISLLILPSFNTAVTNAKTSEGAEVISKNENKSQSQHNITGTFTWPVDNPQIGQVYACRLCITGTGRYSAGINVHTGVDVRPANYVFPDYTRPVRATANGVVEKLVSWGSASHGLGNTVILRHDNGKYSLYGHLDSINSNLNVGAPIHQGDQIGIMGNSNSDCARANSDCAGVQSFAPHVHFEIKDNPTLGNLTDDSFYWGYTPGHPDLYGYHDPQQFIQNYTVESISPVAVRYDSPGVLKVRSSPGQIYFDGTPTMDIERIGQGQEYVAFKRAFVENRFWYFIYLPSSNTPIDGSPHPNNGPSSGWVADLVTQDQSATQVQVLNTLNVRSNPGTSNVTLSKVYTGQQFVTFGSPRTGVGCSQPWYNIFLPGDKDIDFKGSTQGWICGDYLSLPSNGSQTLSVLLSANPSGGSPPLNTSLIASISGTAIGTINYTFWWDCNDPQTAVDQVTSSCGNANNLSVGMKFDGINESSKTVTHTYSTPGTYFAKVIAERGTANPVERRITITVSGIRPTATTTTATSVTVNSAQLHGTVNPNGSNTTCYFQYGTTTNYGLLTSHFDAGSGTNAVSADIPVSGLNPGTTCHYRLVATNSGGNIFGGDLSFTTAPAGVSYSISGQIVDAGNHAIGGVTVNLTGEVSGSTATDSNGNYIFTGLFNGAYTVAPSKNNYTFSPSGRNVLISGVNVGAQNFIGPPLPSLLDLAWQFKNTMPIALSGSSVAVYNNKIHVIGGSSNLSHYRYDPLADSWEPRQSIPTGFGVSASGAAVVGDKIYVAQSSTFPNPKMLVYDPAGDVWTIGSLMPSPADGLVVVAVNGKVFVIGGIGSTAVRVYDPATGNWNTKAAMPTARGYAAGAVVNGLIYVIGGISNGGLRVNTVEEYNPATDSWTQRTSMPTSRFGEAVTVLNNRIYVIGGGDNAGNSLNTVQEYDPAANSWRTLSPLRTPRLQSVSGTVNNKVYVIGGSANGNLASVEEGNPVNPIVNISSTTSLNFGNVVVGQAIVLPVFIANPSSSTGPLTFNAGALPEPFSLTNGNGIFTILPGQSIEVDVRFLPALSGGFFQTLSVTHNATVLPSPLNIQIQGIGIPQPAGDNWQSIGTIALSGTGIANHIAISARKAYVTRSNAHMTVVDLSSGIETGDISFSAYPTSFPFYSAIQGTKAYVALFGSPGADGTGHIAVVDTITNSVERYIPVGTDPIGVAVYNNYVYVTNSGDATVKVIDIRTNTVINTISVGQNPSGIAINAITGKAYIANSGSEFLSVIDVTSNTLIRNIAQTLGTRSIAIADSRVYVTQGGGGINGTVGVIDSISDALVDTIVVQRTPWGITAINDYAFVANLDSNTISILNRNANAIAHTINVGTPRYIAVDPATNIAYITNANAKALSVIRQVAPSFNLSTTLSSSNLKQGKIASLSNVIQGSSETLVCTVASLDTFNGSVELSCSGLPTGVSCNFNPSSVTPPANNSASSTLTISVSSTTAPGVYPFQVIGTSGDLIRISDAILVIEPCFYTASPSNLFFEMSGGSGKVAISCPSVCSWTAIPDDSWIILTSSDNGSGNDIVSFEVRENFTGNARIGTIAFPGQIVTVVQNGGLGEDCSYSIFPISQSFSASGGNGSFDIFAESRCAWHAVSNVPWITITSSDTGIGNGTITFSVDNNSGTSMSGRKGTISVAGKVFSIKQKGS